MTAIRPEQFASADGHVEELTVMRQFWHDTEWDLTGGRPDNAFIFVFSGLFTMRFTDGKTIRSQADELLYIPKGTRYIADFHCATTYDIIVHFQLLTKEGGDAVFSEEPIRIENGSRFRTYFERIADAERFVLRDGTFPQDWKSHELRMGFRTKAVFYEFLEDLTRHILRQDENWRVIERGVAMLEDPACTASVAEVAAVCGVSERTFRRLFERCIGVGPSRYREDNMISYARRMLRGDNRPVGEIAAKLGFRDCSYFCRRFRSSVGCSPTDYRKGRDG